MNETRKMKGEGSYLFLEDCARSINKGRRHPLVSDNKKNEDRCWYPSVNEDEGVSKGFCLSCVQDGEEGTGGEKERLSLGKN